jgi:ParB/RepB/Spo0J family partition protein
MTTITTDIAASVPTEQRIVADELVTDQGVYGLYELARMRRSPDNRKRFNEAALQELAASIEAMGVAQPILIRPVTPTVEAPEEYEIVAGERRYRASIIAGLATIPALCRNLSDLDAAKIRILENLQREDPHPIEEAEGYQLLMQQHGYNADQLAEEVSKSRSYIYGRLKLCALTNLARDEFFENKISASIALLIARIPVKALQEKCVLEITGGWQGTMSFRAAARHIESNYMLDLKKAVFEIIDATLLPAAGPCTTCPKRAGNQPEVFADISADVCTDPSCFKAKGERHVERTKLEAEEAGTAVLSGDAAKKVMPTYYSDLKGGFVSVDKEVWSDKKHRTYRQMLGTKLPQPTLLISPHDNSLHYVIQMDVLGPALQAKGLPVPEKVTSSSAREREMEAAAKLEREYRKRLLRAMHDASLMMNLVNDDLRLVAVQMFENLPWGTIPTKFLIELYGWTEATFDYPRRANIKAAVDALTPAQLNQFIRDCSLCRELEINVYTESKSKPENMLAFAARTKVDAKRIRAEVDAEAQAKKDKKKPATKKTAQATPAAPAAPQPLPADWIDVSSMKRHHLVEFIQQNGGRINDLARAVIARGTDGLAAEFVEVAERLGYVPYGGIWRTAKQAELDAVADGKAPAAAYAGTSWPYPTSSSCLTDPAAAA